jgi:hypothetical protein
VAKLLARPIYGWGWAEVSPERVAIPVPSPFPIEIDVERLNHSAVAGTVDHAGHPLDGMKFSMSCRTVGGVHEHQTYNVALTRGDIELVNAPDGPPAIFGYLMLDPT